MFDLGVVFSGSPELTINAAVNPADPNAATFEQQKAKEISQLQDDLNDFEFWPVVSTGLVYQF